MRIRIMGTAAAEGWPALFCDCTACSEARKLGGKNFRTRSSLQINNDLKIDFPPDTLFHTHTYGLTLHTLKYLLFTHSHYDHLADDQLTYLIPPFALQDKTRSLRIYGTSEVLQKIVGTRNWDKTERPDLLNLVEPYQSLILASDEDPGKKPYEIKTINAVHGTENQTVNYIISRNNRKFLYTCDTGFYADETWEYLKGERVDLVLTECTGGPERVEYGMHLGFPNVQDFRKKAAEIGLSDDKTRWILTHFSHTGGMLHGDLEKLAVPQGYEVAWDGMEIFV